MKALTKGQTASWWRRRTEATRPERRARSRRGTLAWGVREEAEHERSHTARRTPRRSGGGARAGTRGPRPTRRGPTARRSPGVLRRRRGRRTTGRGAGGRERHRRRRGRRRRRRSRARSRPTGGRRLGRPGDRWLGRRGVRGRGHRRDRSARPTRRARLEAPSTRGVAGRRARRRAARSGQRFGLPGRRGARCRDVLRRRRPRWRCGAVPALPLHAGHLRARRHLRGRVPGASPHLGGRQRGRLRVAPARGACVHLCGRGGCPRRLRRVGHRPCVVRRRGTAAAGARAPGQPVGRSRRRTARHHRAGRPAAGARARVVAHAVRHRPHRAAGRRAGVPTRRRLAHHLHRSRRPRDGPAARHGASGDRDPPLDRGSTRREHPAPRLRGVGGSVLGRGLGRDARSAADAAELHRRCRGGQPRGGG